MIKPLVIIPARGGSKGIPGKNIKNLGGKPLINYTIEAAREVFSDDVICVSTDSVEIVEVVEKTGLKVPFIRPNELATDNAGTYEVLLHALEFYESKGYTPDTIILLQPTSPFRTSIHITEALELYNNNTDLLVSVMETKSNPYYVLYEEDENGFLQKSKSSDITRRQDLPVYEVNGAVYIIRCSVLKQKNLHLFERKTKYVMPQINSIDIDDELDWLIAETIISKKLVY